MAPPEAYYAKSMLKACGALALVLVAAACAAAADPAKELQSAARSGDVEGIQTLLASGTNVDARDKNGRTPLMLAADSGRPEAVKLLLAKGANPDARDREGLSAYGLALLSSPSARRDTVLVALPAPPRVRVLLFAGWTPRDVTSSCFQSRPELLHAVDSLHLTARVLGGVTERARTDIRGAIEVLHAEDAGMLSDPNAGPAPDSAADATVRIEVRPTVGCARQNDNLSLSVDVRVTRPGSPTPTFSKTFGIGIKGTGAQQVPTPAQYGVPFERWANSITNSVFWDTLRALLQQPAVAAGGR